MQRRRLMQLLGSAFLFPSFALAGPVAELFPSLAPPNFKLPPVDYPEGSEIPTLESLRREAAALTGKDSPYIEEIDLAIELLFDIPTAKAPHEIAYRFHQWRTKEVGENQVERERRSYYAREWPERGNPVIMTFFDATGLRKPAGDTTYWCAAFVSWCISRSVHGKNPNGSNWPFKYGASSKAYRTWGKDVMTELDGIPVRGDLAVFQRSTSSDQGHVGFVYDIDETHVWVLGGNQGARNEYNGGEVNIAKFSRSSEKLLLHSIRRHETV